MKWEKMQKPLREGMQVFRMSWGADQYMMVEGEELTYFSPAFPSGMVISVLDDTDLSADDWAATGPSGE